MRVIALGVQIRTDFLAYYRCSLPVCSIQIPFHFFISWRRLEGQATLANQESFSRNNIQEKYSNISVKPGFWVGIETLGMSGFSEVFFQHVFLVVEREQPNTAFVI